MDPDQFTIDLYRAVTDNRVDQVVALIHSNPGSVNLRMPLGASLHIAAREGYFELVKILLENGADINLHAGYSDGTPLDSAASAGKLNIVSYLLDQGAVFHTEKSESNPLISAITGLHDDVARLLIERGIDIHVKYGEDGWDALTFAEQWGRLEIARLLRSLGAKSHPTLGRTDY